jgi:hypothetical protein
LPVRPREKRPLIRWEELQHRRAEPTEMERWFERWPSANLGVVTGAVSGLVVIDIDPAHGGMDSLAEIERRHGKLPPTPEARTGGGGRHLYLRHPGGEVHNRVGLLPGIDLRGDGGYVVAPPSIHPSGRPYVWLEGREPDILPLAPMPHWVLHPDPAEGDDGLGHSLRYWRSLTQLGVEEGMRNNTIASLTGHLLFHGVDPAVALELLLCWNRVRCRPPLSDEEVAQTVASIVRTHRRHDVTPR